MGTSVGDPAEPGTEPRGADGNGETSPGVDRLDPVELEKLVHFQEMRFSAVMEIGRALSRTFDLTTLLQIIMEQITLLMAADRSTLFLVNTVEGVLWSKVAQGDLLKEIRMPLGRGIAGWVVEQQKMLNIADAYEDDRFNKEVDQQTGYRTHSILCTPMFNQRREIIGAVQCLNKAGGPFTREDEKLLNALVAQCAVSIENSQLYHSLLDRNGQLTQARQALEHKVAEVDLLFDVEKSISAAMNLEDLLDGLLGKACEVVGAEAASLLLQDDDDGELFFRSATGLRSAALKRIRLEAGRGIAGLVARSGAIRIVNDVSEDPHYDPSVDEQVGFQTRNIVAVPLRVRGKVVGAIELLNKTEGRPFDEEDLKLVTLIAGQASRAISINQAREAEEQADRLSLLGQMVSGILHDLKTPMTVISGHAQLMALEDDAKERDVHSEAILKQFDHINAMAGEIMAFARGQRDILVRKVYLHRFVEEVQELIKHDLERYGVTLEMKDDYRGVARFDETKMKRVITNIARNACQAMAGPGTFTWATQVEGDTLVFTFADTGPGIPKEMEGRLFESFATHGKAEGTGLGLAIVKKIVDDHEGEIEVESEAGVGTTFTVRIPM